MGKARKSKRELVRDEKRKRKRDTAVASVRAKRQRLAAEESAGGGDSAARDDFYGGHDGHDGHDGHHDGGHGWAIRKAPQAAHPEREFFGHLVDEEQEYFRHADELLDLNDFPTPDDRAVFIENVFQEARGKELKLASSQSCSRLMERLILLSTTPQKKHLFAAFAGHFHTLVTHRFASHCCEQLFARSAAVCTEELGILFSQAPAGGEEEEGAEKPEAAMEDLVLYALDELDEYLPSLLSDRFASHTLRVILVVLSGRPLDKTVTRTLLQSKKKEHITVPGAAAARGEAALQERAVPKSFALATRKIIADSTSSMDVTALRVLATHPTGNPTLQLLLELDLTRRAKAKAKSKAASAEENELDDSVSLLERLLPGAPASLKTPESEATAFVNSMLYDSIGSRLLETVITQCPGKVFKALYANIFGPRIEILLRNDIASYPAIKVLERLSKEDLADAVHRVLPTVPALVAKGRFNVVKTLFERCHVRGAETEIAALLSSLQDDCDGGLLVLVEKLCLPDADADGDASSAVAPPTEEFQQFPDNKRATTAHACHLAAALLGIPGPAARAVQTSLVALPPDRLPRLATSSTPAALLLAAALRSPSPLAGFHRRLVAPLAPHAAALAASPPGHLVLLAVVAAPSRTVPFHLKETIVARLAEAEPALREAWMGRSVWRAWRGDLWKRRRGDWSRWAKEVDYEGEGKERQG